MTRIFIRAPGAVLAALLTAAAGAAERLPLFDAHIHYSADAWHGLSAEQAVAILEKAGVRAALVSSTPDEGTRRLLGAAPQMVIPVLRPYLTAGDVISWPTDARVRALVDSRLGSGIAYRGIGEFHLSLDDVEAANVAYVAGAAKDRGLFLHAHVDARTLSALATAYPGVRMLWAHAGFHESPAAVRAVLERFDAVWAELSMRRDVAPGGRLNPAWRSLFMEFPGRFLAGTDTWAPSRWDELADEADRTRAWLGQLPADIAKRIAFENGERLFMR